MRNLIIKIFIEALVYKWLFDFLDHRYFSGEPMSDAQTYFILIIIATAMVRFRVIPHLEKVKEDAEKEEYEFQVQRRAIKKKFEDARNKVADDIKQKE